MDKFHQILIKYWGFSKFRPLQLDIIESISEGKDTLGLLPTGGGKSIIFQVATLSMDGICIVITPLIALMKDQVENLKKRGIKAAAIYSGMPYDQINIVFENCIYGDYKFLYVSPERLHTEEFQYKIQKMNVCLITVDEAHCISQWGYDFRPSYLQIAKFRENFHNTPILALTATATPSVIDDIQDKLLFKEKNVFSKSFERKNIIYIVREKEDKIGYILTIAKKVKGAGIIYVRNRKRTKEIAVDLKNQGLDADYYHAGLAPEERDIKQTEWQKSKSRIMVCTNAFGMGIDKPDVRFVIHVDIPESLEAYFQEAGRAGRDEKQAYAVLLYSNRDIKKIEEAVDINFPPLKFVKNIYEALGNYFQIPIGSNKGTVFDFFISDFAHKYKFDVLPTYSALKVLEQDGYIELTDTFEFRSKIRFIIQRDDLYKFQVANNQFDGFIKILLRAYTGIFTDYVSIDEIKLAKLSNTKPEIVKKILQILHKARVINYYPAKKNPILIYTEERLPLESLMLNKKDYEQRKIRYIERRDAILQYVLDSAKCRSLQLLSYFGQTNAPRCGNCDVCKERNQLELNKVEFDNILIEIKKNITNNPENINDLCDMINFPKEDIIKVIKYLLDNGKINYTPEMNLIWAKKQQRE